MIMIHSYENGRRAESCIEYLKASKCLDIVESVILLPIPTSRDKQTILNTKVYINEVLEGLSDGTLVSGYGLSDEFIAGAVAKGARVIDLERDEDFLLENAELTAVATLGVLLNTSAFSVRDLSVGVVGYGRIGRRLTNLLLYLGARVRVFTSRESTRIDLCGYGVASVASGEDADLSGLDILINTAPASIFPPERIPPSLRVIDLASGDNFGDLTVEKYPSIPSRMFPLSAGKVWGRAIERFIVNNP